MYSTGIAPYPWFQAELKGLSRANYERMEEMKERVDGLRSAREEKRKQVSHKIGINAVGGNLHHKRFCLFVSQHSSAKTLGFTQCWVRQ